MKRVLIVDDDPDVRASLSLLLAGHYEIDTAPDGFEALRCLERFEADAIVLDLMMPIMDGASVMRELKARGSRIPVLLASAHADLPRQAREMEAADYLCKPFMAAELRDKLQRLIPGGPARRD